jgi:hypothetical protein
MRAGKEETRQLRWGNVLVMHGALPGSEISQLHSPTDQRKSQEYLCDAQCLCMAKPRGRDTDLCPRADCVILIPAPLRACARHHSSSVTLRLRFNLPQPGVSIIRAAPQSAQDRTGSPLKACRSPLARRTTGQTVAILALFPDPVNFLTVLWCRRIFHVIMCERRRPAETGTPKMAVSIKLTGRRHDTRGVRRMGDCARGLLLVRTLAAVVRSIPKGQ